LPVYEPIRGEFDAVLESEGCVDEGVELLAYLVNEEA
jgi:hypothetical protein